MKAMKIFRCVNFKFYEVCCQSYIIIVSICLLLSCTVKQSVYTETELVAFPAIQQDDQWIKNNIELYRIVPIETTDDYLLTYIKRVILYKEKLIILDRQSSIFVVNMISGKIEKSIQSIGSGPGESRQIRDIAVDDKRGHILVFNDYEKLLYYSLDGKFLKEEHIGKLFENISYENDNIIFYNECVGLSCYPHKIDIYNLESKKWKTLGDKRKIDFHIRGRGRIMVKSKNLWFVPVLDYSFHVFTEDSIKVPYALDIKKTITDELKQMSVSDFSSFNQVVNDRNIFFGIQSVKETEKYLVFSTNFPGLMMMDKNTLVLHGAMYIEDEYLGMQLFNYFPHDGDDDEIMFIVQPSEWIRKKTYAKDLPEMLKEQIEMTNVDEDSNPILVFYKVKN